MDKKDQEDKKDKENKKHIHGNVGNIEPIDYSPYEKGFIEATIDTDGCLSLLIEHREHGYMVPKINLIVSNISKKFLRKCRRVIKVHTNIVDGGSTFQLRYKKNACRKILPSIELSIKETKRRLILKLLHHLQKYGSMGRDQYLQKRLYIIREYEEATDTDLLPDDYSVEYGYG